MSDARIYAMTALAFVAALFPISLPRWPLAIAALIMLLLSKQRAFIVLLALFIGAHSAHEWRSLSEPLPSIIHGVATVVSDPKMVQGAHVAQVSINDRRYELWARGPFAKHIASAEVGERFQLSAAAKPLSGTRAPSLRRKHIAGVLNPTSLRPIANSDPIMVIPNRLRSLLQDGAACLSKENKALFSGLVYGDDRHQDQREVEEFRAAGLAHLTAVSGANVAYVLLLASPFLKSFGLWGRFLGGLTMLALFGAVTRWEPSVLRAEAMAAVVMIGLFLGRPMQLKRSLCIAVTAALVLDPFLAGSVGFLMSSTACVGMALLGERISGQFPGGEVVQRLLGYSAAAQLGVAPIQLAVFGELPLVGLVTNALADPIAGLVMLWGLPAALIAGAIGSETLGTVLLAPTTLMLEWIRAVAKAGAAVEQHNFARWLVFLVALVAFVSWRHREYVDQTHPRNEL